MRKEIDELVFTDRLEKCMFMLSNILNNYELPRGCKCLNPHDILKYMNTPGMREDMEQERQQAKIALDYAGIMKQIDIARDYIFEMLADLEEVIDANSTEREDTAIAFNCSANDFIVKQMKKTE